MAELLKPDICVIGAGAGGVRAAVLAAAFGASAVLVDKGELGAASIKAGRLPLAALIAAGRRAHLAAHGAAFGIDASPRVDFARVRAHVEDVVADLAPNLARERLAGLGVRVVKSAARFKDRAILAAGETDIAARRFIIATGSAPALPPIAGLEGTPHLTVESVFELTSCPQHLIVIGAGATGLEFAQAFRRLGAAVTVLDAEPPLAAHDSECTAIVLDELAREGIAIRTDAIARVEQAPPGGAASIRVRVAATDREETIEGSHILVAGARWANVVGLGFDAAGIKYDERGVAVDARLRTTNKRVYAIGDAAGFPPEAQIAEQQADLVVRHALLRAPFKFDAELSARAVFTDPELAQVGLTEAEARRRGRKFGVLRWPYRENDRAVAERVVEGHIKMVTGRGGRIIGVTIVGASAAELVTVFAPAIGRRGGLRAVAGMMVPYPTLADTGKWAASTYFSRGLTSSWVRRIIGVVRRLG